MSLITLFLAHFAQHKTPFNKLSRWLEDVGQKKDEETIPHSSPTTQPRVDIYYHPLKWSNSEQSQLIPENISPSLLLQKSLTQSPIN